MIVLVVVVIIGVFYKLQKAKVEAEISKTQAIEEIRGNQVTLKNVTKKKCDSLGGTFKRGSFAAASAGIFAGPAVIIAAPVAYFSLGECIYYK